MIEPLESRIAPAAVLAVTIGKAGITVAEEAANPGSNQLNIFTDSTGALHLQPTDMTTQFRIDGTLTPAGAAVVISEFTGNLSLLLGQGDDAVNITTSLPGNVNLDLGIGTNSATVSDATIGGKFGVKAGPGADTVAFTGANVRLFGATTFALGDGVNTLTNSTTSLLHVGGDFSITTGKDNDQLLMQGSNVQVLGKLTFNTGLGCDKAGFNLTGSLAVARDVTFKTGGKMGNRSDQKIAAGDFTIGGALSMDVKIGFTNQTVASNGTMFIGGAATFTSGGADSFTSVFIGPVSGSPSNSLHVGGPITATTKGPDAEFELRSIAFGSLPGGVTANGFNSTTVQLSGSVGAVKAALATGQGGYFFLGTVLNSASPLYTGAVTVSAAKVDGANMSLLNTIVQGPLSVTGSKGDDIFGLDDVLLLGASKVDLGAGDDQSYIENGNIPTGASQISAMLTILGGAGTDIFNLSGANANTKLNAIATILIDGGADADTVNQGMNGNYGPKLVTKNI